MRREKIEEYCSAFFCYPSAIDRFLISLGPTGERKGKKKRKEHIRSVSELDLVGQGRRRRKGKFNCIGWLLHNPRREGEGACLIEESKE